MFDLEKALAAWRNSFRYHRAFFDEDVEELERHVRDHIAARLSEGYSEEAALRSALQEVGNYSSIESEYEKVFWEKLRHQRTWLRTLTSEIAMLKNYIKVTLRTLWKYKGYSFINITGLAVGLACCLLITLYVRDELSYDRFHDNADRTYRVIVGDNQVATPTIIAPLFKRQFPEVEQATRLYDIGTFRPTVVQYGDAQFQESRFFFADSTIFEVFTLPLIAGNPETALTRARTIVLTESMAGKYFGDEDPLGKLLRIDAQAEYEVTGVMRDIPSNSHLHIDFLASFATTRWAEQEIWSTANFYTYLLLTSPDARAPLEEKIRSGIEQARAVGQIGNDYYLTLQPLTSIYLDFEGHVTYVYLFSAIALLILLIACINYMNLATARSARRAKEVGIRKVSGAHRKQLMAQFYGESVLLTFLALLLSLLLAEALMPAFNALSGKQLAIGYIEDPFILLSLLAIGLLVGLLAGSYPALLLSSFRPVQVLKGSVQGSMGSAFFRKGLVIFQFTVSVILLVGTVVVYNQLAYVQSKNLGFDQEQVVVLPIGDQQLQETYGTLKAALLQHPRILSASAVNSIPGYQRGGYALQAEGLQLPEGDYFPIRGIPADKDIVETLGLNLIAGAGFPKLDSYSSQEQGYVYLVNEATLRELGWDVDDAVGRSMGVSGNRMGQLVGVVNDYHYSSLHEGIEPLAFFIEPWAYEYLLVKLAPEDVPGTMDFIDQTWQRMAPHRPFEFQFLDQALDALYRAEEQMGRIFLIFASLAILIACLGLFGLASFAAEQRTKEIGVRKVLGASIPQIIFLLSKDFTRLVFLALLLGVPLAYLVMDRWLENFAFRTEIGPGTLALAGLTALLIAWLTVSYQSIKAALGDPINALRYE